MDLRGVDVEVPGQLVDRPIFLEVGQGDLGLEPRSVNLPFDSHCSSFSGPRVYLNHWSRKRGPLQGVDGFSRVRGNSISRRSTTCPSRAVTGLAASESMRRSHGTKRAINSM